MRCWPGGASRRPRAAGLPFPGSGLPVLLMARNLFLLMARNLFWSACINLFWSSRSGLFRGVGLYIFRSAFVSLFPGARPCLLRGPCLRLLRGACLFVPAIMPIRRSPCWGPLSRDQRGFGRPGRGRPGLGGGARPYCGLVRHLARWGCHLVRRGCHLTWRGRHLAWRGCGDRRNRLRWGLSGPGAPAAGRRRIRPVAGARRSPRQGCCLSGGCRVLARRRLVCHRVERGTDALQDGFGQD